MKPMKCCVTTHSRWLLHKHQYTHAGHVNESRSLFEHFDENTYEDYNAGWDTHSPTFGDELNSSIPEDAQEVCGGDLQCIFDYAVTNNVSFAAATHATTMNNQETQNILSEGSIRVHKCLYTT